MSIFGQGMFAIPANATPEQVAQKRAVIAAMMPRFGSAKYIGEGLGQLATGFMIGKQNKKLDAAEEAGRKSAAEMFEALLTGNGGGYGGGGGYTPSGTWTPEPPKPDAMDVAQGTMQGGMALPGQPKADIGGASGMGNAGLSFGSATMTPQEMLIAGAEARGLNPIDVATAISYETGGKFDPMISGPTTQWGTHRGLIQFGEPQAAENGVDFSSPEAAWRSQLDPTSGGVWNYLEDAGVKPGMGLPEVYSAINAGAVGRMGASDANNGGAPGTVADKVAGMGPHRENAAAFLGGTWTPSGDVTASTSGASAAPASAGISTNDLMAALANPWLDQQQRAVITTMLDQQMQASDPMRAIELEKAQLELAQMKDPTTAPPEDYTSRMFMLSSLGIDPQSEEGKTYLLTGNLPKTAQESAPSAFAALDMQAQAAGFAPGSEEYKAFMASGGNAGAPAAFVALDMQAKAAGFEPGTPEYQEFMATRGAGLAAAATEKGKATAEAEIAAPGDVATADTTLAYIDSLRNHPGREWGTGGSSWTGWIPGTGAKDFQVEVERLKSGAFLTAIEQLRGMGALSNAEGQAATAAIAALDPSGTEEGFLKRLSEYEDIVKLGRERAAKRIADPADTPADTTTDDAELFRKYGVQP